MLRSMTGYGKAVTELENLTITVEIKSVNSKQLDLNCRLPYVYNEKEPEIRSIVSRDAGRGKVFIGITRDYTGAEAGQMVNQDLALRYYRELSELTAKMEQQAEPDYLQAIMRMPEVLSHEEEELDEKEWKALKQAITEALKSLNNYRSEEGRILEDDFRLRVSNIEKYLADIDPHEKERMEQVKEKFNRELMDFIENKTLDDSRYEQEVVYYLDKLDITEEKVRLKQHCDYFAETMDSAQANGKKLNFISQEMGREINTIGSKANHSAIQKLVVEMKDELEKIKEQLANIL